ncbi:MAG: class I SAM-dependent RNA methyltransferase [Gemmatimonadetes bacterium]|nr:class I SAM-dependent RNA methyltransferase [Gemmatimonadota bacterium]
MGHLPDGRVVFVHRTVPGDRVRVELTRNGERWARARLADLVVPGPDRVAAPCPHYARCGGCTLEHLDYTAQLDAKGRIVADALTRIGGFGTMPHLELRPSPAEWKYRNRVTLTLRRREGGVTAGFHALEDPAELVDVDERCLLPEEPIARAWGELRAGWGPGAARLPAGAELRLTLRANHAGEVLLLIQGGRGRGQPEALLERVGSLRAIWKASGRPGERPRLLAGREMEETWHGVTLDLLPGAFLQGNRAAAGHLHDAVLGELGDVRGKRVLDAYCGFGLYGLIAARKGARSVGIESDPTALQMAPSPRERGFTVLPGAVEDRCGEALPVELTVLNPPRRGVEPGVMEKLGAGTAERIVYVSCDPATLARDVRRLGGGFRMARLQVFDLFPQTARVETVLTLDREG